MAFRSFVSTQLARFNSANSSDFLDMYEHALDNAIITDEARLPSKTFAPSQIRCKRVSWFRLRGVEPEVESEVDRGLNFTAQVGTACHQQIQTILSKTLGKDWVDVEEYLRSAPRPYKYTCTKKEFETQIEIVSPPVKFAPDGIIFWKGKYWLLEIKTSEYSSFEKLTAPKPQHMDQIICYGTLLNLHNVLVIYQDRVYGTLKCFEVTISDSEMKQTWDMFSEVMKYVDMNVAPERLPKGDPHCTRSMCRYYNRCKEW